MNLKEYKKKDIEIVKVEDKKVALQKKKFGVIDVLGSVEDEDPSSVYVDPLNSFGEDYRQRAKEIASKSKR